MEQFFLLGKTAKGAAAIQLIRSVTEHADVFTFAEFLYLPGIRDLENSVEGKAHFTLLELFAYGSYSDYKQRQAEFPTLSEAQERKLKLLTLISLAVERKQLSYPFLQESLGIGSLRALEDLIIVAFYQGLISGKLDQRCQCLEVSQCVGRDVHPNKLDGLVSILERWERATGRALSATEENMGRASAERLRDREEHERHDRLVEEAKASIKLAQSTASTSGGGFFADGIDEYGKSEKFPKRGLSSGVGSLSGGVKQKGLRGSAAKGHKSTMTDTLMREAAARDFQRRRLATTQADAEEAALAETVFGGDGGVAGPVVAAESGSAKHRAKRRHRQRPSSAAAADWDSSSDDGSAAKRLPAWQDEDDSPVLKEKLESKFERIMGEARWADPDRCAEASSSSDDDQTADDAALRTEGRTAVSVPPGIGSARIEKPSALLPHRLDFRNCVDLNKGDRARSMVSAVRFHPRARVALTASKDTRLHFYKIDGRKNDPIQTVAMEAFPIHDARFTAQGNQVILTSRFPRFAYYDMIAGKVVRIPSVVKSDSAFIDRIAVAPDNSLLAFTGAGGYVFLFSATSKELVASIRMNGQAKAVCFSPDSRTLCTHGEGGEVYFWDMTSRQCEHRMIDEGCLSGHSIDVSPCGRYLATGSDSGAVNLYDFQIARTSRSPHPLKCVLNLTTSATCLTFNSSSELLAMSSHVSHDRSLKLLHLSSLSVMENFPDFRRPISRASCVDFSLNSGFLGASTLNGHVKLFRLNHFSSF